MLTARGIPAHALKGDWQEFSYESSGEMNKQHVVTCPIVLPYRPEHIQTPVFPLPDDTEMEMSLLLYISTKAREITRHCAKLTSLDHTHSPVQFPTHL